MRERNFTQDGCINQYITIVRPMAKLFIEPCKETADLVLQNTDHQCNGNLKFDIRDVIKNIDMVLADCQIKENLEKPRVSRQVLKLFFKTEEQVTQESVLSSAITHQPPLPTLTSNF